MNALRQLIDELDGGRFPGLYLVVTGTPSFFEGPQGVQKLAPFLAQRLPARLRLTRALITREHRRFDYSPSVMPKCWKWAARCETCLPICSSPERLRTLADDDLINRLAAGVAGRLGGKTGIAPRLYLKKLVAEVLDRIDLFPDFDPKKAIGSPFARMK